MKTSESVSALSMLPSEYVALAPLTGTCAACLGCPVSLTAAAETHFCTGHLPDAQRSAEHHAHSDGQQ